MHGVPRSRSILELWKRDLERRHIRSQLRLKNQCHSGSVVSPVGCSDAGISVTVTLLTLLSKRTQMNDNASPQPVPLGNNPNQNTTRAEQLELRVFQPKPTTTPVTVKQVEVMVIDD